MPACRIRIFRNYSSGKAAGLAAFPDPFRIDVSKIVFKGDGTSGKQKGREGFVPLKGSFVASAFMFFIEKT
ncbi:hypothetical protein DESC_580104 [Desulfosarcina cetonica]|nr:hypothetical protein DESC_580104 [Desulfosarcina cetonica]